MNREKMFQAVYDDMTGLELAEYLRAWFPGRSISSSRYGERVFSDQGKWDNWSRWREKVCLYLDSYLSVVEDELGGNYDNDTILEAFIWKICLLAGVLDGLGLPEDCAEAKLPDAVRELVSSVLFW